MSDLYYRVIIAQKTLSTGPVMHAMVVEMQPFDEHDYDQARVIPVKFTSKRDADNAAHKLDNFVSWYGTFGAELLVETIGLFVSAARKE